MYTTDFRIKDIASGQSAQQFDLVFVDMITLSRFVYSMSPNY